MKKIILALACIVSMSAWAGETRSMRTPQGDLVRLGDSEASLIEKMGRPTPKHYVLDDGRLYCAATQYTYDIDLQQYKVILCRDKVVKILWENK